MPDEILPTFSFLACFFDQRQLVLLYDDLKDLAFIFQQAVAEGVSRL
jgi:hypothetical protein